MPEPLSSPFDSDFSEDDLPAAQEDGAVSEMADPDPQQPQQPDVNPSQTDEHTQDESRGAEQAETDNGDSAPDRNQNVFARIGKFAQEKIPGWIYNAFWGTLRFIGRVIRTVVFGDDRVIDASARSFQETMKAEEHRAEAKARADEATTRQAEAKEAAKEATADAEIIQAAKKESEQKEVRDIAAERVKKLGYDIIEDADLKGTGAIKLSFQTQKGDHREFYADERILDNPDWDSLKLAIQGFKDEAKAQSFVEKYNERNNTYYQVSVAGEKEFILSDISGNSMAFPREMLQHGMRDALAQFSDRLSTGEEFQATQTDDMHQVLSSDVVAARIEFLVAEAAAADHETDDMPFDGFPDSPEQNSESTVSPSDQLGSIQSDKFPFPFPEMKIVHVEEAHSGSQTESESQAGSESSPDRSVALSVIQEKGYTMADSPALAGTGIVKLEYEKKGEKREFYIPESTLDKRGREDIISDLEEGKKVAIAERQLDKYNAKNHTNIHILAVGTESFIIGDPNGASIFRPINELGGNISKAISSFTYVAESQGDEAAVPTPDMHEPITSLRIEAAMADQSQRKSFAETINSPEGQSILRGLGLAVYANEEGNELYVMHLSKDQEKIDSSKSWVIPLDELAKGDATDLSKIAVAQCSSDPDRNLYAISTSIAVSELRSKCESPAGQTPTFIDIPTSDGSQARLECERGPSGSCHVTYQRGEDEAWQASFPKADADIISGAAIGLALNGQTISPCYENQNWDSFALPSATGVDDIMAKAVITSQSGEAETTRESYASQNVEPFSALADTGAEEETDLEDQSTQPDNRDDEDLSL